jgi:multidrug efflux pump subunit AcrA (membrane-fusion protein)
LVVILVGAGGYACYAYWFAPDQADEAETVLETATVTVGDLSLTADGSGVLVASSEVELAFSASGTLMELLVKVGDQVQAGDVLGWIDDTDARNAVVEAELNVMQAEAALDEAADTAALEQAVAQAELVLAQKQADLEVANADLAELVDWSPDETEVEIATANLAIAQANYQVTLAKANMVDEQMVSIRVSLEEAIRNLEDAQANYVNAMDAARDWERNIDAQRESAAAALQKAQDNLAVAQANYDLNSFDTSSSDVQSAWIQVLNAQETLEELTTAPEQAEITAAQLAVQELEVAVRQAQLDLADAQAAQEEAGAAALAEAELNLEQAQLQLQAAQETLDGSQLVAPTAGTVTEINATVGETVSGTALVLADLETPVVQFWVEESDLTNIAVGNPVNIVFEALPDLTYSGSITSIDPILVTVSNTTAVQAWADLQTSDHAVDLLGDMNAEVEIVAGEALNTLLVPVQALREIGEDQYVVFVVRQGGDDDGELEMRPVEVGLMDYVNAEILSGVQQGEVVSVGESTTSSAGSGSNSTTTTTTEQQGGSPDGGMMMPPMMGG